MQKHVDHNISKKAHVPITYIYIYIKIAPPPDVTRVLDSRGQFGLEYNGGVGWVLGVIAASFNYEGARAASILRGLLSMMARDEWAKQ